MGNTLKSYCNMCNKDNTLNDFHFEKNSKTIIRESTYFYIKHWLANEKCYSILSSNITMKSNLDQNHNELVINEEVFKVKSKLGKKPLSVENKVLVLEVR